MEGFIVLNIINFADMTMRKKDRVSWNVESFITIKLNLYNYLVFSLNNGAKKTLTETDLRIHLLHLEL